MRRADRIGQMSTKSPPSGMALAQPSAAASPNSLTSHANTLILFGLSNNWLVGRLKHPPLVTAMAQVQAQAQATTTTMVNLWKSDQSTLSMSQAPSNALVQSHPRYADNIDFKDVVSDAARTTIGFNPVHYSHTHQARVRRLKTPTLREVLARIGGNGLELDWSILLLLYSNPTRSRTSFS